MSLGATPESWAHWEMVLGLGDDLLPVVADTSVKVSDSSKLKQLGKVPSRITPKGEAVGFPNWTSYVATSDDIEQWSKDDRLGICLQMRRIRAIDVDIGDPAVAEAVHELLKEGLGALPCRTRNDSAKFLLLLEIPGSLSKRVIKTAAGAIEFLATGQQAVIDSTHTGGARYEWRGGLPLTIPRVPLETFGRVWRQLEEKFAIEPGVTSAVSTKAEVLAEAVSSDPVVERLAEKSLILGQERDGRVFLECPFIDEHERESDMTATCYFPAHTGGYSRGTFKCLHSPCEGRSQHSFLTALGVADDPIDDFEVLEEATVEADDATPAPVKAKYTIKRDGEFMEGEALEWIVKGFLPRGEGGVIYGPPGSGKSFLVEDLAYAVARGVEWRGHQVKQGRVLYCVGEGAAGFRGRLKAYRLHHNVKDDVLYVLDRVPNLLDGDDVRAFCHAVRGIGRFDLIVFDTLARATVGGDENSAKDMGLAMSHLQVISVATGAMPILVHHSGKDISKGARGSNAILGAVDWELEVQRIDERRVARLSKMKDGTDDQQLLFKLTRVPIGMDEDNEVIESCVVEHIEGAIPAKRARTKRGVNEERVYHAFLDMQKLGGEAPSVEKVISAAVEATPFDGGAGKRDLRRRNLMRALETLCSDNVLRVQGGAVHLVEEMAEEA